MPNTIKLIRPGAPSCQELDLVYGKSDLPDPLPRCIEKHLDGCLRCRSKWGRTDFLDQLLEEDRLLLEQEADELFSPEDQSRFVDYLQKRVCEIDTELEALRNNGEFDLTTCPRVTARKK